MDGEADVGGGRAHLDRERGLRDQIAGVRANDAAAMIRSLASSNSTLVRPSSRLSESERSDAAQGNMLLPYLIPSALALFSVTPTQATSGSAYATDGIHLASREPFLPAATSVATLPSCTAVCASIGWPMMSPIAKMCGTSVRICWSAGMKPPWLTRILAFSAPINLPLAPAAPRSISAARRRHSIATCTVIVRPSSLSFTSIMPQSAPAHATGAPPTRS